MINGIKLSELNSKISIAISDRFGFEKFWVIADITNHSFKADKQIHYFELVEKATNSNIIIACIAGKASFLFIFEKNYGTFID